jgi:hypothetical protein
VEGLLASWSVAGAACPFWLTSVVEIESACDNELDGGKVAVGGGSTVAGVICCPEFIKLGEAEVSWRDKPVGESPGNDADDGLDETADSPPCCAG